MIVRGKWQAFTLAEVLIALVLLGVVAAFTIPKMLTAQNNADKRVKALEAVAMISEAYQAYKKENTVTENTGIDDLIPYLNYLGEEDNTPIDYQMNNPGVLQCSTANSYCIRLHSGAILLYKRLVGDFSTPGSVLTSKNATWFYIDPDGKYTGQQDSIVFFLYTSGRITSWQNIEPGTLNEHGILNAYTYEPTDIYAPNPPWFKW